MDQVAWPLTIGAGIGLLGATLYLVATKVARRKTPAEAADIITQAASRVILDLEKRIADLEKRLKEKDL